MSWGAGGHGAPPPRYCTEIYNWRWHYYFLTNEGIEFLRQELHLPAQVPGSGRPFGEAVPDEVGNRRPWRNSTSFEDLSGAAQ